MSELPFDARRRQFEDLAAANAAAPTALCDLAWEVIGGVLYDNDEAVARLLPWAYEAMERVADTADARNMQPDISFDARTAIACWGIFQAVAHGKPVFGPVQWASARKLGELITSATSGSYQVDTLALNQRRKIHQVMGLALLMRNTIRAHMYGLPSPPFTHDERYFDQAQGTTSYHMHAIGGQNAVPIYVSDRIGRNEVKNIRGVLPILLGPLLVHSARNIQELLEQSLEQGDFHTGQDWLINQAARGLSLEQSDADSIAPPVRALLRIASHHLRRLAIHFNSPERWTLPGELAHMRYIGTEGWLSSTYTTET